MIARSFLPKPLGLIQLVLHHWDSSLLLAFVTFLNFPLVTGGPTDQFRFSSQSLQFTHSIQLITHPFTHVSWYHFLLDASAFFTLYLSLLEKRPTTRLFFLVASGLGSLSTALIFHPEVVTIGFCGLSGIAHGIMAVWSLELITHPTKPKRILGTISLATVTSKCAAELIWQSPMIEFLHFHLMGTPILPCHAGGVAGGLAAFFMTRLTKTFQRSKSPKKDVSL